MPTSFISGDLFCNRVQAAALAHGCNCKGSMGAGVAVGFKDRYPAMFEAYRSRCKAKPRLFNPGDVFLWTQPDAPAVFNLATQEDYWRSRATYPVLEAALTEMRAQADAAAIPSIAMPRVGAGLGGLSWNKCRAIIERAFLDWPGNLYVYDAFVPEDPPDLPA
jgi:O-acetyl-ADP-ribose deacetylase (regulator of RNase III)